jgi:hypothetical protein
LYSDITVYRIVLYLFLVWCGHKDGLYVPPHVQLSEKAVTLIEDEVLHLGQIQHLRVCVRGEGGGGRRREGRRKKKRGLGSEERNIKSRIYIQ